MPAPALNARTVSDPDPESVRPSPIAADGGSVKDQCSCPPSVESTLGRFLRREVDADIAGVTDVRGSGLSTFVRRAYDEGGDDLGPGRHGRRFAGVSVRARS